MAAHIFRKLKAALRWPGRTSRFLKWDTEELFVSGQEFFDALIASINAASTAVWLETYIFKDDPIGERVFRALDAAAQRGVDVRLLVDGVGSQDWIRRKLPQYSKSALAVKIFRPIPLALLWRLLQRLRFSAVVRLFGRVNRRTHRKLALIDGKKAFVGSLNICAEPVESVFGNKAWQETAVAVTGRAVICLIEAFEETWHVRRELITRRYSALVRDNRTLMQRLRNHRRLLRELEDARKRIYITTAYFIPERRLRRLLRRAARKGLDVRIIVPASSDVFFLPWVSRIFYTKLKDAGVHVLEFQSSMIHSKTMIIDNTAWIGSSNLNSRSLYWDRELDVRVLKVASVEGLLQQFGRDQANAKPYEPGVFGNYALTRLLGLLLMRLAKLF